MDIGSHASEAAFFVSVASVAWSAAFAWARWLARPREDLPGGPEYQEYLAIRIAHVEQAVNDVRAEIQQLGETQRLAARTLAERIAAPERALAEPRRVITPH